MKRFVKCLSVGAVLALGCDGKEDPKQPPAVLPGSLGRAEFLYECVGEADPQCDQDADLAPTRTDSPFPVIAVGSRFQLFAESGGPLQLGTASGQWLALDADGATLTALRAGVVSVVASQSGTPLDFADIELREPAALKILPATPQGSFEGVEVDVANGQLTAEANVEFTFKFRAIVVGANGEILAGDFPCNWSSSDPDILQITSDPVDNIVTVVSGNPGPGVLEVELGDFSGTVSIEVGS